MRKLLWSVVSAFALGAAIAFAFSLVRRPHEQTVSGYDAPIPADGPEAA